MKRLGREQIKSYRFFAGVEIFAVVMLIILLAGGGGFITMAYLDYEMRGGSSQELAFSDVVFERVSATRDHIADVFVQDEGTASSYNEETTVLGESRGDGSVSMTFAGDILFDPEYAIEATIKQRGGEIASAIDATLLTTMQEADVAVINNEFPYSNEGSPTPGKTFTFRAPPDRTFHLKEMGIDLVTLANNHIYDYGETGFLNTLTALNNADVSYVGAGVNIAEASAAWHYTKGDVRIAVLAATDIEETDPPDTKAATDTAPGVFRSVDTTRLLQRIREEKDAGYFVIVLMHWGRELETAINWMQERQAPEIAAAGADLIVGAHPHILQQISYIDGVPVVYSLGNFLFNSRTLDSALLRAEIGPEGLRELRIIPAIQSGCTVRAASAEESARIVSDLNELSGSAWINEDGVITPR